MLEQINNLNLNDYNNNSLEESINIIIQLMVEAYLKSKGEQSMNELLKSKNIENVPGKLYNYHIAILQTMINEELLYFGTDLQTEVVKRGFTFQLGELSEFEKKFIVDRVSMESNLIDYGMKVAKLQ